MPRPDFEMDPDDLRRLDESVEQVYSGLKDSEDILTALSRIDHGDRYRYISGYDEDADATSETCSDPLVIAAVASGSLAVWCGAMSVSLQVRGYEGWSGVLESTTLAAGIVSGVSAVTWGVRKAIRQKRGIDKI